MTDILRSILLGIIQGLTEFLPVSSSGHLEILNFLIGSSQSVDSDLTMVVLVHAGTAFSILYVFRDDIQLIIKDLLQFSWNANTRLAAYIVLSMIPALIVGLVFEEQIEALFSGEIWMVGIALICTGIVLWMTPNDRDQELAVGWKSAIIIGCAQAVAIMPGISRSGMTIAIALMLGIGKKNAARFSFLMVLPVILGKILLDILSGEFVVHQSSALSISVAFLAAFVVGVMACSWMIKIVKQSKLIYFSWYCFIIGAFAIGLYFYG